jgi:hypothetical protein
MRNDPRWHFREISREIRKRIEAMGFVARGPIFQKNLRGDFHGFMGFNRDRLRNGCVGINPVLGVWCDFVYKEMYRLGQLEWIASNTPPIVFSPLGYLSPKARYREWHVVLGEDNRNVLDEMFDAIRQYGLPFYEKYQSIDAMIEAIEHRAFWQPDLAPYTYPIMLVMKDRIDEAVRYVEAERDRRSGIGGRYEDDYRRFADNFLKDVDRHRVDGS